MQNIMETHTRMEHVFWDFGCKMAIRGCLEHLQPKCYIVNVKIFYYHSLQMLLQPDLQNVPIVKKFYNTATVPSYL